MRSFSKLGLYLNSQTVRARPKPKHRIRKIHAAGQAKVPAARNKGRVKKRNSQMNSPLTFRLKYSRMCGHRAILMNISLGKKGRSPCGDQPGRVKFKKKAEGALLTWILAHCKRS